MTEPDSDRKKGQNPLSSYGRYSSVAFQMGLMIAAGSFGGYQLDKLLSTQFPVFTIAISIMAVFASMWLMVKELNNKNNKK